MKKYKTEIDWKLNTSFESEFQFSLVFTFKASFAMQFWYIQMYQSFPWHFEISKCICNFLGKLNSAIPNEFSVQFVLVVGRMC